MFEDKNFMQTHFPYIVLVVVLIISTLILFSILGIDFNPADNEVVNQDITFNTSI
jgi:hypothetical protein